MIWSCNKNLCCLSCFVYLSIRRHTLTYLIPGTAGSFLILFPVSQPLIQDVQRIYSFLLGGERGATAINTDALCVLCPHCSTVTCMDNVGAYLRDTSLRCHFRLLYSYHEKQVCLYGWPPGADAADTKFYRAFYIHTTIHIWIQESGSEISVA